MQGSVREIAVDLVCADGRRLPVLINSVLKKDEAGTPLLVRTTVFNATDRKEYERELLRARQRAEQAAKAKADFISMISHEIRTPLNAIMGVGHLLGTDRARRAAAEVRPHPPLVLGEPAGPDQRHPRFQQDRGRQGRSGRAERSISGNWSTGLADNLRVKAEEKGLALEVHVDERMPAGVLGDPIKIGQVLTNLLGNAIKFTPRVR